MTVRLLCCWAKHTRTRSWQALTPLRISSGEDLHSAPGRSTDKLPRRLREAEALAEGRNAAQTVSHPSEALCGASRPRGPDRGGQTKNILETGRPGGRGRTSPPLPGAKRGLEDRFPPPPTPPRARLRPAAPRLSLANQPRFSQSKIPTGETGPKCLAL